MPRFLDKTELPFDANANPIPVVAPSTSARIATVGAASSNVALPGNAAEGSIVRVAVTQDCYIAFGTSGVTAANTDVLLTSGLVEYFQVPNGATHIAAIRVSTDGTLTITEMI